MGTTLQGAARGSITGQIMIIYIRRRNLGITQIPCLHYINMKMSKQKEMSQKLSYYGIVFGVTIHGK